MRAAFPVFALFLVAFVAAQDSAPAESRPETPVSGVPVRRTWFEQHQDQDGSWSPAGFQVHCSGRHPCTGLGKEEFRVAATALMLQCVTGAGYPSAGQSERPGDATPRRALRWLISRQRDDGGFVESRDPSKNMTNACAAIALSRALVLASGEAESRPAALAAGAAMAVQRVASDQYRKGAWIGGPDPARSLSTNVWCVLALRAGSTAGVPVDPHDSRMRSGLTAIEREVARIEAPPVPHPVAPAPALRLHARAARAVARAACGASPATLAEDVEFVLRAVRPDQDPPPDAEVLLFTTIAAMKCADSVRDPWLKLVKTYVVESQVKDGCAAGTWSAPTVWWDQGGRLASTAFMTWVLELYYRYPHADWV